jgi:hypothetical protein
MSRDICKVHFSATMQISINVKPDLVKRVTRLGVHKAAAVLS